MSTAAELGYRVVDNWERLPEGTSHKDVPDVAVDSRDRVYVLTRMDAQVLVYDRDGTFLGSWGEGSFSDRPHGITIGPDDTVYIVDEGRHAVEAYTTEGRRIAVIGPSGSASDTGADAEIPDIFDKIGSIQRPAGPYNKPTKLAVAPNGDFYVTDGYGNARVHHFDAEGRLLSSWGEPGSGPGQFHLPHSVVVADDGRVLVADRENDRIQLFSAAGDYLEEWNDFHRVAGLFIRDQMLYVAELAWRSGYRTWRNGAVSSPLCGRVSVLDLRGNFLVRLDDSDLSAVAGFTAPHGLCADSRGDIYVAEVTWTDGGKSGLYAASHSLLKLTRTD
ncbi:MAG TPA: peptidyl-alpha-hydroxyglycine alpha-amidating lyase family protein [Candidatus Nitrosotalea sp.]|nr:peptidyl-alpha-hydroxyglycine alpha-amidating lyase family protein [Candidatus Nitrosotalea sp.]